MAGRVIRLLCEASAAGAGLLDLLTGKPPEWVNGDGVAFEVGLTNDAAHLISTGVGTITAEVKRVDSAAKSAALMRETAGSSDCDATFVAADWNAGGKQLTIIDFTAAEAAISEGEYILSIIHDDPGGVRVTHAQTRIKVRANLVESASLDAPPTPAATYYTKTESDARYPLDADMTAIEGRATVLETAKIDRAAPSVDADLDLQTNDLLNVGTINATTVAAGTGTASNAPTAIAHLTRKDYVDQFAPTSYAQSIMTGGLNVINSGAETRTTAVGSANTHAARWLATDDTNDLQVEIVRRSITSPVEINFVVHGDSSAHDTPVHIELQRNLDIDGAGSWVAVAQGDSFNSAQRVTASLSATEDDDRSIHCAAMTLIDTAPIASSVAKVAYRILASCDAGDSFYINTPKANRVARLDASDAGTGTNDDISFPVSTLLAKELFTP